MKLNGLSLQIPNRLSSSASAEPFLNGSNAGYVEEMYNSWLRDPASVHAVRKLQAVQYSVKITCDSLHFSHGTRISATTRMSHLRHWHPLPRVTCRWLSTVDQPRLWQEVLVAPWPPMSEWSMIIWMFRRLSAVIRYENEATAQRRGRLYSFWGRSMRGKLLVDRNHYCCWNKSISIIVKMCSNSLMKGQKGNVGILVCEAWIFVGFARILCGIDEGF